MALVDVVAADIKRACDPLAPDSVYPFGLLIAAAPGERPFVEVEVGARTPRRIARCLTTRGELSLAAHARDAVVTGMVHAEGSYLAGVRPARLPAAAKVRAAWRAAMRPGRPDGRALERLLPAEVVVVHDDVLFRPDELVVPATVPLGSWLTGGLARIGGLGPGGDPAYLDGDLLLVAHSEHEAQALFGMAFRWVRDAVTATRLSPVLVAFARRGLLPGFYVGDESSGELVDDFAVRTDASGTAVEVKACDNDAATGIRFAVGVRGLPAGRSIVVRALMIDEDGDAPAWRADVLSRSTASGLDAACDAVDSSSAGRRSLEDEYERRARIVRVEPTPVATVRKDVAPIVLYRVTLENRAPTRTAVYGVGCSSLFRESVIPLAPGERRSFVLVRPAPYMFQGTGELDCSPGRKPFPLRLPYVYPFDVRWLPPSLRYTACSGPADYHPEPDMPDPCVEVSPEVVTLAPHPRPLENDGWFGEGYYGTYLDDPVVVECNNERGVHRFRVSFTASPRWPLRIPIDPTVFQRSLTCTIDPAGATADADRTNNVVTLANTMPP